MRSHLPAVINIPVAFILHTCVNFKIKMTSKKGEASGKIALLEAKRDSLFELTQYIYNLNFKTKTKEGIQIFMSRSFVIDTIQKNFLEKVDHQLNTEYLIEEINPNFAPLLAYSELYSHIKFTQDTLSTKQTNLMQTM